MEVWSQHSSGGKCVRHVRRACGPAVGIALITSGPVLLIALCGIAALHNAIECSKAAVNTYGTAP